MKFIIQVFSACLIVFLGSGCASKPPTIAHTHVGHAMTGWHDTPAQTGLFIVSEEKAQQALLHAENAEQNMNQSSQYKREIEATIKETDAQGASTPEKNVKAPYGVKQALIGAADHITFAASSSDASENVKVSAKAFAENARAVVERCDLIVALGEQLLESTPDEAAILTPELVKLTKANVYGEDTDNDGVVGSDPTEYGVVQLRADLDAMIAREDPPYTTVDSWYLFNLIRLPSGEWIFRQRSAGQSGGYDGY